MREITDPAELDTLCGGDPLCRWATRGLTGGVRAFAAAGGAAVAVASPDLSRRDRPAVHGTAADVVDLVRAVLPALGRSYRPIGDPALIGALVARLPGLEPVGAFGWMDRADPLPAGAGARARWLPSTASGEVGELLDAAFPASYARPGVPGVWRWAGVRDTDGTLAATAALAWSAPRVGLVAGVAVRPAARGRGLAREVTALAVAEAIARHGRAALIVDEENAPARAVYRSLGLAYRPLAACRQAAGAGRVGEKRERADPRGGMRIGPRGGLSL